MSAATRERVPRPGRLYTGPQREDACEILGPGFEDQTYLTVADVGRVLSKLNGGRLVAGPTITRWLQRGIRNPTNPDGPRVILRGTKIGSRWIIPKSAVAEFLKALTPALAMAPPPAPATDDEERRRLKLEMTSKLAEAALR